MKKSLICLGLVAMAGIALAQQPAAKEPMPLATAWANVVAACKAAQMDVLTGRQGAAVDEALRTLQPVLASWDVYAVDIEKLIAEKKAEAPKAEAETP